MLAGACLLLAGPVARAEDRPLRILVLGDSQAQGLAGGLQRLFRRDEHYRVVDRSRIATGLIPRPRYDWPGAMPGIVATAPADVAVVMFGANDRPNVWVEGSVNPALDARFRDSYAASVRRIIQPLRQAHIPVIWVGHPIVRDARFAADMRELNEIFSSVAAEEGIRFLPLWDAFADKAGQYAAYGLGPDGQTTRLRADDGVHLTAAGYDLVASTLHTLIDAPPALPPMAAAAQSTPR